MEKYIFDIPIYRCDIDKHTHESENEKKKYQSLVVDAHGEEAIGSDSYLRMWVNVLIASTGILGNLMK
jgi:hypothetical protein